jgi:hypothetical protein
MDAASLIAVVAQRTEFGLLGGFFESGEGGCNSYNTSSDAASVKGSVHARYTGLGPLGRYDLNKNLYLEGTLRGGRSSLNFASKTGVMTKVSARTTIFLAITTVPVRLSVMCSQLPKKPQLICEATCSGPIRKVQLRRLGMTPIALTPPIPTAGLTVCALAMMYWTILPLMVVFHTNMNSTARPIALIMA